MSSATTVVHSSINSSDAQATPHQMQHSFHNPYQQGQQQPGSPNGHNTRQQQMPNQQQQPPFYPQYPQFPVQQYPIGPQQQQLAQWAYQQMMYQQNQLAFQPHGPIQQYPYMNGAMNVSPAAAAQQQQQQHHHQMLPQPPYARENNGSRTSLASASSSRSGREDTGRKRTISNKGPHPPSSMSSRSNSSHSNQARSSPAPSSASRNHQRMASSGSQQSNAAPSPTVVPPLPQSAANRSYSSSSSSSAVPSPSSSPASSPPSPSGVSSGNGTKPPTARQPTKPSPLSQDSSKRMSKDDGELTDTPKTPQQSTSPMPNPTPAMIKSGGLTGRLRRALSFSAINTLEGEGGSSGSISGDHEKLGSRRQVVAAKLESEGQIPASRGHMRKPSEESSSTLKHESAIIAPLPSSTTEGSIRSSATNVTKNKKRSLFNSKFNASTDNISLSSTVSSASMMIRKLGSVGQLARRNSLMKISNLFKDKEKKRAGSDGEEEVPSGRKGKGKKSAKGEKSEASVTHATVELERGTNSGGDDMVGLSPAAKLARQHTLRTNAAEAARAKAEREARDKENKEKEEMGKLPTPTTWENNTTSRAAGRNNAAALNRRDHGSEDELSDDGTYDGNHQGGKQAVNYTSYRDQTNMDSDSEGDDDQYQYDEEDDTAQFEGHSDEVEPWAVGLRRSVERTLTPAKGILKYQSKFGPPLNPPIAPFTRTRSNSYDLPVNNTEPGPLSHIPPPDPDHIDGLHRSNSERGQHSRSHSTSSLKADAPGSTPFLPPLEFDSDTGPALSAITFETTGSPANQEKPLPAPQPSAAFAYTQPSFNASAPTLSLFPPEGGPQSAPATHRSATAPLVPSRKLTFAANLSVYHTFAASVYDRRSEPATCNRLTPALAQRIKEELNSYKMEEMEVHALSRAYTHFLI
ncbi:hypothetical protein FRC02_010773 [Tulasnella sp. 418]|nr:hypothetical protein FRC02_010773 [Tulasnella sp. 418]